MIVYFSGHVGEGKKRGGRNLYSLTKRKISIMTSFAYQKQAEEVLKVLRKQKEHQHAR